MIVDIANKVLAIATILAQLFMVGSVAYVVINPKRNNPLLKWLGSYGLQLAFLTALAATMSSLFYSEVAHFPPCDLCWFQRVFMYPLVVILALAIIKKDSAKAKRLEVARKFTLVDASLWLAGIGFLVSFYHNMLYYYNEGLNVLCQFGVMQTSCVKRYVFEFGYVTIPLMSLTAFLLVIIFLLAYKLETANRNHV